VGQDERKAEGDGDQANEKDQRPVMKESRHRLQHVLLVREHRQRNNEFVEADEPAEKLRLARHRPQLSPRDRTAP